MFDIGSSLREARTRQSLDFPELEQITKIRPKYLRALEDERFDILPAPTYVRGFLRSYAEALGLDGQPFVDEYNSRFAVESDEVPIRARRVPQPKRDRSGRESRIAVLAVVGILIVTALVIAAFRFGGPEDGKVPGLKVDGQSPAGSTTSSRRATLVVRAVQGGSFMEVRAGSSAGRLLYSGTLQQGQTSEPFQARTLQLALARPQNVVVRLNGKRVELPRGTAFVITAQRITRASS